MAVPEPTTTVATAVDAEPRLPANVNLTLKNYAIVADVGAVSAVSAEQVILVIANNDSAPHNVVLLRTRFAPDHLPTVGIRVDEGNAELDVLARTPTIRSGTGDSLTVAVAPGTYVLVCTVPHHYVRNKVPHRYVRNKMFATLSVQ